jgi:hypothetical protein
MAVKHNAVSERLHRAVVCALHANKHFEILLCKAPNALCISITVRKWWRKHATCFCFGFSKT